MIEIAILIVLIFIAIVGNIYFKDKRRQQKSEHQQAYQTELQQLDERKAAALKKSKLQKKPESVVICRSHIPEDAALKRHYLSQLRSMIGVIYGYPPSDSTLNRHYRQLSDSCLDSCKIDSTFVEQLVTQLHHLLFAPSTPTERIEPAIKSSPEPIVHTKASPNLAVAQESKAEPVVESPASDLETVADEPQQNIPEDSALRRHYLSQFTDQ